MKTNTALSAVLAAAGVAQAQRGSWWNDAPNCAQSCLSSFWSTATSAWPAPTDYCTSNAGPSISSCVSSACSATPTVFSSYSSLSSSLCSEFSSCTSSGSTGVYTVSAPSFTGRHPGGPFGPGGPWGSWSPSATWTGGVYTVTGCDFDGSPWAGGPNGWGVGGFGSGGPFWGWGNGWTATTTTTTVTATVTVGGSTIVTTGLAIIAEAVSGDITSLSTLGIVTGTQVGTQTGTPTPTGNAAERTGVGLGGIGAGGESGFRGVAIMGLALASLVAVVGML